MKLLAVNPGSTSTKLAVFDDEELLLKKNVIHQREDFVNCVSITDQKDIRKELIVKTLEDEGFQLAGFSAVVGRGGFMKPVAGGVYPVTEEMLADLANKQLWGREHASNLGAFIAKELAASAGIPAYVADPVVVDEMEDIARFSGVSFIKRKSLFHALNMRACARRAAAELGRQPEECNFVIIHMGGGTSVAAFKSGRCIDVNNALLGMGPFSPQRAGALPIGDLLEAAYSGRYTRKELTDLLTKKSGLMAYTGTDSGIELENRIVGGDEIARTAVEAMAYQIVKEAGAMAAVLAGQVDAVVVTGGLAHMEVCLMPFLRSHLAYLGRFLAYPGEEEMGAMAQAVLRVLQGLEEPKAYGERSAGL